MRTKTLLLSAAVTAAGMLSSMAQVYSVNAVGYVNVTIPAKGYQLIANPLLAADSKLSALLPNVKDGTTVYKYDPATGYSVNTFFFGAWGDGNQTLVPGEGAFVLNGDTAAPQTLTFVGEVAQGDRSHAIPAGFSIQSSEVPQAGKLTTDLNFPAADGDAVYKFNAASQSYDSFTFFFGGWSPSEPTVDVGESVFVNKAAAANWTRTFNVNG